MVKTVKIPLEEYEGLKTIAKSVDKNESYSIYHSHPYSVVVNLSQCETVRTLFNIASELKTEVEKLRKENYSLTLNQRKKLW